ncbi:MAG: hypothetical protein KDB27_27825 [Planctomycetales bacterium]|nr:hypothetical protein [Planctomycetales bacterium]
MSCFGDDDEGPQKAADFGHLARGVGLNDLSFRFTIGVSVEVVYAVVIVTSM